MLFGIYRVIGESIGIVRVLHQRMSVAYVQVLYAGEFERYSRFQCHASYTPAPQLRTMVLSFCRNLLHNSFLYMHAQSFWNIAKELKIPVHIKYFDRDKSLEAILFIANSLHPPTFHSISKIFYLSEKLHLQEYGRMICGDRYIAMENGPVPSAIYDMMKVAAKRRSIDIDWDEIIRDALDVRHGRELIAKRDCNPDMLAESEVECIRKTIAEYGKKTLGEFTDITHDSAWHATDDNQTIPMESIVATLPNAAEVAGFLHAY